MSLSDANALFELRDLTETLTLQHKERLLQALAALIQPNLRDPLEKVVYQGVKLEGTSFEAPGIRQKGEDVVDLSTVLRKTGETKDGKRLSLMPAPLAIRKLGQDIAHKPHVLTPLTELTEPTSRSLDGDYGRAAASTGETDARLMGDVPKAILSQLRETKSEEALAEKVVEEETDFTTVSSGICSLETKKPGYVRNGRLAAEARKASMAESSLIFRQTSLRSSSSAPSLSSACISQTGSILFPRDEYFRNPRPAPKPPRNPPPPTPPDNSNALQLLASVA